MIDQAAVQIIEELARAPRLAPVVRGSEPVLEHLCTTCNKRFSDFDESSRWLEPSVHRPGCLWRRAKEFIDDLAAVAS